MDVPMEVVQRLRAICEPLPDAYEEEAWVGIRFRIRKRNFVHFCAIDNGHRPAILRQTGPPFWTPPWRQTVVGLFLDDRTDWDEVAELVTESYCVQAPQRLGAQVHRPAR